MPFYEYEHCEAGSPLCEVRFTLRRRLNAPELTHCPLCRKPVRKVLSAFSTPSKLKPFSVSQAKGAGFTVLKKTGRGEYERQ